MNKALLPLAMAALLFGCDGRRETREVLNMPDMHFQPSIKAQEPQPWTEFGEMMKPVPGTVPMDWQPYTITNQQADELASQIPNPLPASAEVLLTGQRYFNIFCTPCHGEHGDGMGTVIRANAGMPLPPSLHTEKDAQQWTDGRIFRVITRGQGNMPSYQRIEPEKRWAIIHYVRALQRSQAPTEQDLRDAEQAAPQKNANNTKPNH